MRQEFKDLTPRQQEELALGFALTFWIHGPHKVIEMLKAALLKQP
jgi:hypothetical protein